jgi:hypothetical protein
MKRLTFWTLLIAIAFCTGCSSLDKDWKKKLPWSPESRIKTSKFETPSHLIAIWSPDVLAQPGKPPARGFGGRIYFYNEKNQAVPVEGQLVVYGYDDLQNSHHPGQPQRKFAFTPDQFTKHFSNSELGASYSIWIPWDEAGGEQRHISLVPIFTATSGQVVMGQQAINVLPGRSGSQEEVQASAPQVSSQLRFPMHAGIQGNPAGGIQAAAFERDTVEAQPRPRLRTSTIHLTPALQRRLAQNTNAPTVQTMTPEGSNGLVQQSVPQPQNAIAVPQFQAPTAMSPQQPGQDPPSTHFEPPRFPVRAAPGGRSIPPAPWTPPYPATPPSALQSAQSQLPMSATQAAW